MTKEKVPMTQALPALEEAGIPCTLHTYKYREHGGTDVAAKELGVEEHAVVKTLVFEDERREPLLVLMHGDRTVSTNRDYPRRSSGP